MRSTIVTLGIVSVLATYDLVRAAQHAAPPESGVAAPLGNAITYQGKLEKNGVPLDGNCNFIFTLFDAASSGAQVGSPVTLLNQSVIDGLFTVALDFPGGFDGSARWISIQVQGPGDPGHTELAPRQAITAAPYALYALNAPNAGNGPWTVAESDVTCSVGSVGVTGASSPFTSGKGVFLEGGNDNRANVWAFNYDTLVPVDLLLNYPGGRVSIGALSPAARLDVRNILAGQPAVRAENLAGAHAIYAETNGAWAITGYGKTNSGAGGIQGISDVGRAVEGRSTSDIGVVGDCVSAGTFGMLGTPNEGIFALSPNAAKPAARFRNTVGGGLGLWVEGNAKVSTLTITGGADLAEPFDVTVRHDGQQPVPGNVVVIDADHPGRLRLADQAYDTRVAGVISGANGLTAGMVLHAEGDPNASGAHPIAMTGRVWCWTDASDAPIRPGDRLTTSTTPGHAMRCDRPDAEGSVIGKAMTSLDEGRGLVLVLVNLQ